MKTLIRTQIAITLTLLVSTALFAQYTVGTPGSLESLTNILGLPVIDTAVKDGMFSSTDPQGHGHDCGNFMREDNGEYVLAEMNGPGVITRIWSANAHGKLRIYLDDKEKPAIECMFQDIFENKYPPFQSPVSAKSSGGWYSYWPIGYEKYCKVAVAQDPEITRKREDALKAHDVSVSLKGAKQLRLIVNDAGDGYGNDHCDWADARLVRADGSVLYLSDVTDNSKEARLTSSKQGWGHLRYDTSVDEHPISINGRKFDKGLGTHTNGELLYDLPGDFDKFEAVVGLDDEVRERKQGTVIFRVSVDGKQLYESPILGFSNPEGSFNPHTLFYHINYSTYPEGTKIIPFTKTLSPSEKNYLKEAIDIWRNDGKDPVADKSGDIDSTSVMTIAGGKSIEVCKLNGSGFIYSLKMKLKSEDERAYRRTVIKIYWDGEEKPSVCVPYGDFFGSGFGHVQFNALPFGMGTDTENNRTAGLRTKAPRSSDEKTIGDGECYCYWIMPFAKGARIEIDNGSTMPVQIQTHVTWRKAPAPPENVGRFCAQWREEIGKTGKLLTLLDVKGRGKYVGCIVSAQGLSEISYLEGNEQYFIDGEEIPSMVGTGTEDFFNGGWYYNQGMFDRPLHGLTEKETTLKGRTSQYRIQIPDAVTFRTAFKLLLEHGWNNNHIDDNYATTTFFYMVPPIDHSYSPPPASELNFPRRVLVRPNLPGRGAEGDKGMGVIKMRGGDFAENVFEKAKASCPKKLAFWKDISKSYEGTNMAVFMWWPRTFIIRDPKEDPRVNEPYNGDVIICDGKKTGDYLDIPASSGDELPGEFICRVWLVKGPDYGKVNVSIGGKLIAEDFDLYAPEVMPAEVIDKTPIQLPEGSRDIRIELVGKNEKSAGNKFGFYVDKVARVRILPSRWKIIGPFDFDSSKAEESFAAKLQPETKLDLTAKYQGKAGIEIGWQVMPERMATASDYQWLNMHDGIPNGSDAVAYLHTFISVPGDMEAVLKVASDRPVAVFLNGKEVYRKVAFRGFDTEHPEDVRLDLKKGENSLLVKAANKEHDWRLSLQFANTEGGPACQLSFSADSSGE